MPDAVVVAKTLKGVNVVDSDDFFRNARDVPDDSSMLSLAEAFTWATAAVARIAAEGPARPVRDL